MPRPTKKVSGSCDTSNLRLYKNSMTKLQYCLISVLKYQSLTPHKGSDIYKAMHQLSISISNFCFINFVSQLKDFITKSNQESSRIITYLFVHF